MGALASRRGAAVLVMLTLLAYTGFHLAFMPVHLKVCPDAGSDPGFYRGNASMTVVTMYLNIGSLKRTGFFSWLGFDQKKYSTDHYRKWLMSWGKLQNPVIAFFDDDEFITQFKLLRSHLPAGHTTVVKVDRRQLPAFRDYQAINDVIKRAEYETSYPAEYTCVMSAKYDALEMALRMPELKTDFLTWMDIGLFRRLEPDQPLFALRVPPGFNTSRVGVSEVTPRADVAALSPRDIYHRNVVWVAGGYLLAHRKVVPSLIAAYRRASSQLLAQGLADTDQQVLGSMYSPQMRGQQPVQLSPYACPRGAFGLFGHGYLYFCLPYICKEAAACHAAARRPLDFHPEART